MKITAGNNDYIVSGSGNSVITLGANDSGFANAGISSYIYTINDGAFNLTEGASPATADTTDSLIFGAGITANDLAATVSGNELMIAIADGAVNDNVNIFSELNQGSNKVINDFVFADNSSLTLAQILALPIINNQSNNGFINYSFTNQDQTYINNGVNDSFFLSNGNDSFTDNGATDQIALGTGATNNVSLSAGTSADSIYLNSGNATVTDSGQGSTIIGGSGNAIITAGANDSVFSSAGNSTIALNQNDFISSGGGIETLNYAVNDGINVISEGIENIQHSLEINSRHEREEKNSQRQHELAPGR